MIGDSLYKSLMEYALRALARRAHTSAELRQKLRRRPHHSNELEELVLSRLIELKLIDDEAFVKRQVETAQTFRHEGLFKVAYKLQKKGILQDEVKRHWRATGVREEDIAREALKKIAGKRADFEKRARYLAGRGFSPETIYKVLKRTELS